MRLLASTMTKRILKLKSYLILKWIISLLYKSRIHQWNWNPPNSSSSILWTKWSRMRNYQSLKNTPCLIKTKKVRSIWWSIQINIGLLQYNFPTAIYIPVGWCPTMCLYPFGSPYVEPIYLSLSKYLHVNDIWVSVWCREEHEKQIFITRNMGPLRGIWLSSAYLLLGIR